MPPLRTLLVTLLALSSMKMLVLALTLHCLLTVDVLDLA
jgi:hypothetical protein